LIIAWRIQKLNGTGNNFAINSGKYKVSSLHINPLENCMKQEARQSNSYLLASKTLKCQLNVALSSLKC